MDQEANFGAPLSDPSNADFQRTIAGWQALTNGSDGGKLHIWNYVSSFSMPHVGCDAVFHDPVSCGMFIQPFPNYWVLGPNINFFSQMGVTGVFEVRREPSHNTDAHIQRTHAPPLAYFFSSHSLITHLPPTWLGPHRLPALPSLRASHTL